jgi:DNA-binding PadR family transcriptional regulator
MRQTNLYKGSLTTIVLKLLSETTKMYGYEITQKVKAITEGALYPLLHKLEAENIIN